MADTSDSPREVMPQRTQNGIKQLLLSGEFLAAISAVGYLGAFLYERAYASHFRIPLQMISLTPTTLFAFIATLFVLLPVLPSMAYELLNIAPGTPLWLYKRILAASPILLIVLAFPVVFGLP